MMPEPVFQVPKQKEDVLELMRGLGALGMDAEEIAEWLNDAGMKTYVGDPWTPYRVRHVLAYGGRS